MGQNLTILSNFWKTYANCLTFNLEMKFDLLNFFLVFVFYFSSVAPTTEWTRLLVPPTDGDDTVQSCNVCRLVTCVLL